MDELTFDYLESLKDLPALLEQREALIERRVGRGDTSSATDRAKTSNDDAIFRCLQPLLFALIDEFILWFGCEDGGLRSLNRLRYTDGMIILEFGPTSVKLGPENGNQSKYDDYSQEQ